MLRRLFEFITQNGGVIKITIEDPLTFLDEGEGHNYLAANSTSASAICY